MPAILLYVEVDEDAENNILRSIRAIEGVKDGFLIPPTSNLYQLQTCQSLHGPDIASRIGVVGCVVSRPLEDNNHATVLAVTGMTCNSCVKSIETTVGQMEGINSIKVSLSQSEAFIEYQPTVTTAEKLCTVICDMGFDASIKIVINSNVKGCNNMPLTEQVTLSVVGMVCMSCVNNIQTNIGKMVGIKSVNVSLDQNTATIEYCPATVTPKKICEAIEDLGFEASTLTDDSSSSKTVIVGIEGMTCNSCVKLIENTVGAADGIVKISVSLDKKEAVIEYNYNTLADEDIKNLIEGTGFEVTCVQGIYSYKLVIYMHTVKNRL